MEATEGIRQVALSVSTDLGAMVNDDQMQPFHVMMGASRAAIIFWMGCVEDGKRVEALEAMRQFFNEEINNMIRGISNGMVPA